MRRSLTAALLTVLLLVAGACTYATPRLDVAEPRLAQSTKIFAADGRLITTLLAEENRENIRLADLPDHVVEAVIAIEDARYWDHKGVDVKAILRAAVANTAEGDVVEGGSTITQQYVKNTLLDGRRTIERKLEEAVLAVQLERRYTKERILELYLNTIFFGNGAYGIQAAAAEYFGVRADELSVAQAATLAGLIRAPSAFDPHDNHDAAVRRRDRVIRRMRELGWIGDSVARAAVAEPLELATRTIEDRYAAPHFVEQVKRFVLDNPRFGRTRGERQALLFGGGLRISTTVDLDLQAKAEEAVHRVLADPGRNPDGALVSLEPATGFVRALVGGRDFFGGGARAKLDLVTGGPGRPAGSAFKPLVLAAALEEGIRLDKVYRAPSRLTIPLPDQVWEVENYEGSGGGSATLLEATIRSYNTVYAQLIQEVGAADAMAAAARLGVESPLLPYPSAVLGTNDVHPIDMAASYATFANHGLRVGPAFVTKIVAPDGRVLYKHDHRQERVLDPYVADLVTGALQGVVEQGTGTRARIGRPVAGKTGTGQEWRDAWFVGYTPDLATAVWIGFADEGRRSMVPPATPIRVSGGTWPAQIWQLFMSAALAEVPVTAFRAVEDIPPPEPDPVSVDLSLPRVPHVVGMPVGPAEATLTREGFTVERREVPSDDYPPGYVASQTPAGGSRVEGGSRVVLDVANGKSASAVVPDVLGLPVADAEARLRRAGFTPDVVVEAEPPSPSADQRSGRVWKQAPAGGSTRAAGSEVTIWANP